MYRKTFEIRWADLDPNRHLRHSAYPDYATHLRFSYLTEHGFPPARFTELDFGPVILRESTTFRKEVGPGETITLDFRIAALAPDASRFRICHEVVRSDGKLAATVEVEGAWMNLTRRKLTVPDSQLAELLRRLPRTKDFEELEPIG